MQHNLALRDRAKQNGVCLWEIADRLGIQDSAFSRKLRRELPEDEQRKIIEIIEEIRRSRTWQSEERIPTSR